MPAFECSLPVRFGDIDQVGIVYYPRYFDYFHLALEFMWEEGFGFPFYQTIETEQLGLPIVHVDVDWQSPLRYGDHMTVKIVVDQIGKSSMTLKKSIFRESDGTLCAEGTIIRVAINRDTFESIPIPDKYRELLKQYSNE